MWARRQSGTALLIKEPPARLEERQELQSCYSGQKRRFVCDLELLDLSEANTAFVGLL